MHAARFRIDETGKRVGVGAAQFLQLPPVEHEPRDLLPLRGQFFENVGIGRPRASFRSATAVELEFAEQNVAELLRRADVEGSTGEFVNFALRARCMICCEFI